MGPRVAVVTGVGRIRSIGSALAVGLAGDGWDLILNYWTPYDDRLGYVRDADDPERVADTCRALGVSVSLAPGDLSDPSVPARLFDAAARPVTGLVMSHCESEDSSVLTTDVDSWDRHFAVNARATWLLIKAFAEQLDGSGGRIAALTSDHTAHNLPYGASKGALDRIVTAAAVELADLNVRANVVNPGPVDTGWMTENIREAAIAATPAGRLGTAEDTSNLVRFLFSDAGSWINGQVLYSNGGFRIT
ncbi:short-chain dehydrogenase [Rhodococcus sp. 06-156-3C]|uniref:SDR family oxidoreductase n=1 Tax=Nocardiaceae TaxID=85025 RepID=UPI000522EF6B|nr:MULTISPECIES: SDR family oxidoreductase [Rhodococcus]OZD11399.1 short-chain dehydrogenase [Rhodococcus sp. 06-156-3C]OZD13635.1 short-chain dehydrogenase [Rhodococcus sp. 06-156-4a]OZD22024.1 short-chain dehydrogenase [Rhodococcus sp. 06-156-4C]OZD30258.1 short-chain dehydrogenase [Rhodococcus sp. 06-156-3]OZD37665.1 short-chain dehydrogenase [Rhodococcus sp. 06-156-3b]